MRINGALPVLLGLVAVSAAGQPAPPPLTQRTIAPSANELRGTQAVLTDRGIPFTLFLPPRWSRAVSTNTVLVAHFHTVPWFAVQEHVRRDAEQPLIVFQLGEGSSTYRAPFEDTNRFARMLALVESELRKRGAPPETRIAHVDLSSFSAGYGAVRELLQSPESFRIIRRVVLLDSLYAALEPAEASVTHRRPLAAQIDVWVPLARAAMRGEKTFVITHSQVPTPAYASSGECASALLARLEVASEQVEATALPAARDPNFPLLKRADAARFHVWSYGGENAAAHLTHVRHLADVWRALDAIESK